MQGMQRLVAYGEYVETLQDLEEEDDCFQCRANREVLEEAWQVVANEFYDPTGRFSQAKWASELQKTLHENGGARPKASKASCSPARCCAAAMSPALCHHPARLSEHGSCSCSCIALRP